MLLPLLLAFAAAPPTIVSTLTEPTPLSSWKTLDGDDEAFAAPEFDDSAWLNVDAVGRLAEPLLGGVVWYRTTIELSPRALGEREAGATLGLALPRTVGPLAVYVDGVGVVDIGRADRDQGFTLPFSLTLPGSSSSTFTVAIRSQTPPMMKNLPDTARAAAPVLASSSVADLAAQKHRAELRDGVVRMNAAGLFFLLIGLYHLLLWFRRRTLLADLFGGLGGVAVSLQPFANAAGLSGKLGASAFLAGGMAPGIFGACWFVMFALLMRPGQRLPRSCIALASWSLFTSLLFSACALLHVAVPLWPLLFMANLVPNIVGGVFIVGALIVPPLLRGDPVARLLFLGYVTGFVGAILQNIPIDGVVGSVHIFGLQPVLVGFMGFAVGQALALARSYAITLNDLDRKNRDLADVNLSMARFLPDAFLSLLSRGSVKDVVRGDNTELEISVLFSDIRGFTGLSEKLGTRKVFELINKYLEYVEPTIHGNHGFISQYYGDGVMALFANSVDDAVASAAAMHHAVARFNETRVAAHEEALVIGVGLNTGRLMLGTIGGKDRLACNVIGDPVNLAARIEGMTKMYGARVLISQTTASKLTLGRFSLRKLDRVIAKGKTEPMSLFEVLDADPAPLKAAKEKELGRFATAVEDLQAGRFEAAANGFAAVVAAVALGGHDDHAAQALAVRAAALAQESPASWDGATRLVEK